VAHTLEQVDLIRERIGVSYKEAAQALDQASGDTVQALVVAEQRRQDQSAEDQISSIIASISQEVKASLQGRPVERIDVKVCDETIRQIPVALVGVGAALMTLISMLLTYVRFEVVPARPLAGDGAQTEQSQAEPEVQHGESR